MGIIIRQSFWNMVATYTGFVLGAVNVLILYANFFSKENYGLVMSLVSLSAIVMPFIAIGMNNALLRFSPTEKDKNALLSFSLFVPTVAFFVIGGILWWKNDFFVAFFPQGEILKDFAWLGFAIAVFSAFFEVFYGYAQAHLRSIEGVVLRELFYRVATSVLLFAVFFGWIDELQFCYYLTASFAIRLLLMMMVCYRCEPFHLKWFDWKKYRHIITYGAFSSLGMAIWAALLEFDKSMLPFYESLTTEAYYTLAVFIGMTVAVPYRSLYQIANPILSKAIAENDVERQKDLAYKSSLNSLILCGLFFLLINCNINDIYSMLPKGYENGITVVLIISVAKLIDSISGLAGSHIVYSKYYRWDLVFSVCLMACIIGTNFYFIPRWGMNGASMATLISLLFINSLRVWFVWKRFGVFPFKTNSFVIMGILVVFYFVFSSLSCEHLGNKWLSVCVILTKSIVITVALGYVIYRTKYSTDINQMICSVMKKLKNS
ncbi:MAG: oligosaccharide flippase family protein [Flavobacteriales bacterium]|nr:oligosaccharide flippase family protein [Flavobacteriales bacterium]